MIFSLCFVTVSNSVDVSPPPDDAHSHLPPHSFPATITSTSSPLTSRHFQPSSQQSCPHTAPADSALPSFGTMSLVSHVAPPTPPLVYSEAPQATAGGVAQSSARGVAKPPAGGVAKPPAGPGGVSWSTTPLLPAGGVAPPGGVYWGVAPPPPQVIIGDQPVVKGVGPTQPPIFATTASGGHASMGVALGHHGNKTADSSSEHRHYKFSIDLRTLHNLSLEPGIKCYLRYVPICRVNAVTQSIERDGLLMQ